ncbi:MAG: carbon storage regulator [Planctomycetaceae bacterium]
MLVLTRKATETIQIGDGIVIKVIKTGRGSVKIGIEAPDNVRVMRGELCEAVSPTILSEVEDWTPTMQTSTQSAV